MTRDTGECWDRCGRCVVSDACGVGSGSVRAGCFGKEALHFRALPPRPQKSGAQPDWLLTHIQKQTTTTTQRPHARTHTNNSTVVPAQGYTQPSPFLFSLRARRATLHHPLSKMLRASSAARSAARQGPLGTCSDPSYPGTAPPPTRAQERPSAPRSPPPAHSLPTTTTTHLTKPRPRPREPPRRARPAAGQGHQGTSRTIAAPGWPGSRMPRARLPAEKGAHTDEGNERAPALVSLSHARAPSSLSSLPPTPTTPQVQEVHAEVVAPEVADSRRTFLRG
jgi:hypothetical protein